MTKHRTPADLGALHGQQVEVEEVDLLEDADGIPSWIQVVREMATVVIVPSLLQPPAHHAPRVPHEPPYQQADPVPEQQPAQEEVSQ